MKRHSLISLILFTFTLLGCNEDGVEGRFTAQVEEGQLELLNTTPRDVYYFAADEGTLALISWTPIISDDTPKVESGQTIQIPLTDVLGYTVNSEVIIISYWNAIEMDGELVAGPIQTLTLNL